MLYHIKKPIKPYKNPSMSCEITPVSHQTTSYHRKNHCITYRKSSKKSYYIKKTRNTINSPIISHKTHWITSKKNHIKMQFCKPISRSPAVALILWPAPNWRGGIPLAFLGISFGMAGKYWTAQSYVRTFNLNFQNLSAPHLIFSAEAWLQPWFVFLGPFISIVPLRNVSY